MGFHPGGGRAIGAAALAVVIACGAPQGAGDGNHVQGGGQAGTTACTPDAAAIARAGELRGNGRLLEALAAAETVDRACPTPEGKRRLAELLEDGWSFDRAAAAWKAYAATGPDAKAASSAALERLRARPSARRPNAVELDRARVLIRAGRLLGDPSTREYDRALDKLRQSYELWPHPSCLVEMARVEQRAGKSADAERSLARALLTAEGSRGASATPTIEVGHLGRINQLALSPDGRTLAIASRSSAVVLWDSKEDRALQVLHGHTGPVRAVAFDAKGALVAAASDDGSARVWDVTTGQPLYSFEWVPQLRAVTFSPDGSSLLTGGEDGAIRSWKLGGAEEQQILAHDGAVQALSLIDVDGTPLLASGGSDGAVKLWSLAAPRDPLVTLTVPDGVDALALYRSPLPGTRTLSIAAAGGGGKVHVWQLPLDTRKAPPPRVLTGHKWGILALAFDGSGEQLASGGWDKKIRIWDVGKGKLLRELAATGSQADEITGLQFDAKGDLLAASRIGVVAEWDTDVGGDPLRVLGAGVPELRGAALSADGRTVALATSSGHVLLWRPAASAPVQVIKSGDRWLWDLELSPDGTRMATASEDGRVRIIDLATGKEVVAITTVKEPYAVAFSPDGKRLAAGGAYEFLGLWDAATGATLSELAAPAPEGAVFELVFVDDSRVLASMSANRVRLWDLKTGAAVRTHGLSQSGYIMPLAVDTGRTRFAAGAENGSIGVWELATGRRLVEIPAHAGSVRSLAFSPDGKRLASTSVDQSVKIWDPASGALVAAPAAHATEGRFVAYTADGTRLWTADAAGTLRLDRLGRQPQRRLSLHAAPDGGWLAIGPDGEVDADAEGRGLQSLSWRVGDVRLPGEVAFRRHHVAGLLARQRP